MGEHPLSACLTGLATGLAVGLLAARYHLARPLRIASLAATDEEIAAHLPGDELCPDPDLAITRAVTISAPPNCVWPFMVQPGSEMAARYSCDWLEKRLASGLLDGSLVSSFALVSQADLTRLIRRNRIALPQAPAVTRLLLTLILKPVTRLLDRQVLLGIKVRAEQLARDQEFADDLLLHSDSYVWTGEHL